MGLSITQSLARTHDGELKVESFVGQGSVFTLHLPVEVADEPIGMKTNLTFHEPKDNSPIRLLVVDDDDVNRLVFCTTLQRVFINAWIDQAANCTEGFEKMSAFTYNLVLIDLVMPDIDGAEVVRRIHSQSSEPFCSVPVIALTANLSKRPSMLMRRQSSKKLFLSPLIDTC